MSTNTGVAPVETIADTVGMAVLVTVITSSPEPIPKAFSAKNIAFVPLSQPTPYFTPTYCAYLFSKLRTDSPRIK